MKIKNVEGFAGLYLGIYGRGNPLAEEFMEKEKISGSKDWQKYTITIDFPAEADSILVGGVLLGKGDAWFDHFVLTIDGKNVQTLKESDKPVYKALLDKEFDSGSKIKIPELTTDLINNLELLGRIWGFLKYHHPGIANGNINWDYELFRFLPEYLKVKEYAERDKVLSKWIDSLGKIENCDSCLPANKEAFLKPDLDWIETGSLSQMLKDKLRYIYQNRHQGYHFYIGMVPGVGNPIFKNENTYSEMTYPDDGFRLLALFRYWNMIYYFYPNKYLTDKNWNSILKEYIPKFQKAKNEFEYESTAIQIIGEIHDTHAILRKGNNKIEEWKGNFYPPFHVRFIENKLVVDDYFNQELTEQTGLEVGDIIQQINGKPVNDIVASVSDFYPASNQPTQLRNISFDILRSQKSEMEIIYAHNGKDKTKTLKLYSKDNLNYYKLFKNDREKSSRLLLNNIAYITLKTIKDSDVPEIKDKFKDTKGIIIDIRNYPSTFVPYTLGSFFVKDSTAFVKFTIGNINNPGEFTFSPESKIPGTVNSYSGKLIVIVNELTQSSAEFTAMAFRAGMNTTVIGSTTAGADGNVSEIYLPGGLMTRISGIGVFYPDGTETQRVGIVPDIEVKPTIKGFLEGKDELLEKAVEYILND